MDPHFDVAHLDVEKLLADWRRLCPKPMALLARNAFADLFLRDEEGAIFRLDVARGELTKIADSAEKFLESAQTSEKREEWFAESDERAAAARGLTPGPTECIGFSVPLVFAEAGSPDTAFVCDIYDHVGFLGDLHRQIATLPDGSKVRLRVKR